MSDWGEACSMPLRNVHVVRRMPQKRPIENNQLFPWLMQASKGFGVTWTATELPHGTRAFETWSKNKKKALSMMHDFALDFTPQLSILLLARKSSMPTNVGYRMYTFQGLPGQRNIKEKGLQ